MRIFYLRTFIIGSRRACSIPLSAATASQAAAKERMLPSVNMILPYVYPGYFFDVTEGSIRGLSKTALKNAMQILRALEREHQRGLLSRPDHPPPRRSPDAATPAR